MKINVQGAEDEDEDNVKTDDMMFTRENKYQSNHSKR